MIMKLAIVLALIGALVSGPVLAEVVRLAPSRDTTIYSESSDLSNGTGEFLFSGRTAMSYSRRTLLAFDIAQHVPAGSRINSVTLTLHISQSPGSALGAGAARTLPRPEPFVLHRVIAAWSEGTSDAGSPGGFGTSATANDATWTHRSWNAATWARGGGDFKADGSAGTVVPVTSDELVTWGSTAGMVADVQDWLDNPTTNFGWVLIGNEAADKTARRFDSRENRTAAHRPVLMVDFVPPAGDTSR
jgi:hypothetical protein